MPVVDPYDGPETFMIWIVQAFACWIDCYQPDASTADEEEASSGCCEVRKLVRYLDICDGNMEEGSLRRDANVSKSCWKMQLCLVKGGDQKHELHPQMCNAWLTWT